MKVQKKGFLSLKVFMILTLIGAVAYGGLVDNHIFYTARGVIVAPFLYTQASCVDWYQSCSNYLASKASLSLERDLYRKRSQELQGSLIALKAQNTFIKETQELKEYKDTYQMEGAKLARVLLKQCSPEEHFFLISLGSSDGVVADSAVVYKNCVVGKVVEVQQSYSKVLLITDRHCKVAVFCASTKTAGIYEGAGSSTQACLNHVSHMQKLEVGDTLLSAGEGLIFPYGFGVGIIESFTERGIQYEVKVKPMLDVLLVDYCYVIPSRCVLQA